MTQSLDYLAKKLSEKGELDEKARLNLEALNELRDMSVHFYHQNSQLSERALEIGIGCLKNFVSATRDWFAEDLSKFNFYLMPLSFVTPPSSLHGINLSNEEKSFLKYIDSLSKNDVEDATSKYSVAVNVEVKFVRSKSSEALAVQFTNDPNAPAVRVTEEQMFEKYPWDYDELTKRCRERYSNFKVGSEYHAARKKLEKNSKFAHERRLSPSKPSPVKRFYNSNILQELDKHFPKRK